MTVRAFKLDLEDRCEDFEGRVLQGTMAEQPHTFDLDDHHTSSPASDWSAATPRHDFPHALRATLPRSPAKSVPRLFDCGLRR